MTNKNKIPIFEVWDKYETIAMHFNVLLIKLRTQALGGVAAIVSVMVVISKDNSGFNWALMAGVFFFLIIFWVAIWVLDFKYYNQLLVEAVDAILEIEKQTKNSATVSELKLSHKIKESVAGRIRESDNKKISGKKWYYSIVLVGLIDGFIFIFSIFKHVCK